MIENYEIKTRLCRAACVAILSLQGVDAHLKELEERDEKFDFSDYGLYEIKSLSYRLRKLLDKLESEIDEGDNYGR